MFGISWTLSNPEREQYNQGCHNIPDGIDSISDQGKGVSDDPARQLNDAQQQVYPKPHNRGAGNIFIKFCDIFSRSHLCITFRADSLCRSRMLR